MNEESRSGVPPEKSMGQDVPDRMAAVVVLEPNRLEIRQVDVPFPGPGQVLARVRAVSICGTDGHLIRGDYPGFWPPSFPFTPGHEWAGDIVALGSGAENYGWRVGDRVAGTSHDACGVCQKCVEGHYNLCENYGVPGLHRQYGHNIQGAFANYVVQGVKTIFRLPSDLSYAEGAVADPASIALHVANRAQIRPGDTVAVVGAGAIGLLAADCALVRGAARVVIVANSDARLEMARSLGFETIDSRGRDPVDGVRQRTEGRGVDVTLECAGTQAAIELALAILRRGGRCAAVGIPTERVLVDAQRLVLDELEFVGSRASAGEMRHVLPLIQQGRVRVRDVITHHFALADFPEALATLLDRSRGAVKVVVEP